MYSYAGYYQIRRYGINALFPTSIDNADESTNEVVQTERDEIMDIAADVTQAINELIGVDQYADYMPFSDTRSFDARQINSRNPDNVSADGLEMKLDAPLLSLTSVTLGDDTSITIPTDILQIPKGRTPTISLALQNAPGVWTQYTDNWRGSIGIVGVWGNRKQYDTEGWIDSGDTVQDSPSISATVTTITVSGANGANSRNHSPRFDIGQIIRIESEYCIITNVNYTANTIEVIRGVQGTAAAVHLQNVQIDVFIVEPNIMRACAMIVAFEYERRGKFEAVTANAGGQSISVQPELWPTRAMRLLPVTSFIGAV